MVHHEFLLCSLMWTLVDIQWVTFLRNYIAIHAESWKKFWKCFNYYFTVCSLLRYEFYKSPPSRVIIVLCSGWIFECFYSPWCSIQICWEDSVLLWVWVERRTMWKLRSFGRKGRSKNCMIVRIVFFFLCYFKLTVPTWDRNFPFHSDNVYFKCT